MVFHTLVSTQALATQLDDASWRIFDCRHDLAKPEAGEQAYRAAHIPNAQFLHLDRDLSGPVTGSNGRHPLPDPATFAATLARRGVSNDSQVIAYDDSGGMFAVRLWWMLRWLGHDKVAVLDGGLPAWQSAGYALSERVPRVPPAVFSWRAGELPVDGAYVQTHLAQPGMLLMDARGADRFRGENETLDPVAGHIPGAVNRPFRNNLVADGHFKPAAQLRREFEELLGEHPAQNTVCYCGSGVTACVDLLALHEAGRPDAKLYPGSWSQWSRRGLLFETGA